MKQLKRNYFIPEKLVKILDEMAEAKNEKVSQIVRLALWEAADKFREEKKLPPLEIDHMTLEDMQRH